MRFEDFLCFVTLVSFYGVKEAPTLCSSRCGKLQAKRPQRVALPVADLVCRDRLTAMPVAQTHFSKTATLYCRSRWGEVALPSLRKSRLQTAGLKASEDFGSSKNARWAHLSVRRKPVGHCRGASKVKRQESLSKATYLEFRFCVMIKTQRCEY